MPVSPSARFQVDEFIANAPGNCFVCKSSHENGPYIRTGLKHDHWKDAPDAAHDGDVYICRACILDMGSTLDLHFGASDTAIHDARLAGIAEGLAMGKKILHDYVDDFIPAALRSDPMFDGSPDLLDALAAEDANAELAKPEAVSTPPEQVTLPKRRKGSAGVSSDRSDDVFAD